MSILLPWYAPFTVKPPTLCVSIFAIRKHRTDRWSLVESLSSNVGWFTSLYHLISPWLLVFALFFASSVTCGTTCTNIFIFTYGNKGSFLQCRAYAIYLTRVLAFNSFWIFGFVSRSIQRSKLLRASAPVPFEDAPNAAELSTLRSPRDVPGAGPSRAKTWDFDGPKLPRQLGLQIQKWWVWMSWTLGFYVHEESWRQLQREGGKHWLEVDLTENEMRFPNKKLGLRESKNQHGWSIRSLIVHCHESPVMIHNHNGSPMAWVKSLGCQMTQLLFEGLKTIQNIHLGGDFERDNRQIWQQWTQQSLDKIWEQGKFSLTDDCPLWKWET